MSDQQPEPIEVNFYDLRKRHHLSEAVGKQEWERPGSVHRHKPASPDGAVVDDTLAAELSHEYDEDKLFQPKRGHQARLAYYAERLARQVNQPWVDPEGVFGPQYLQALRDKQTKKREQ